MNNATAVGTLTQTSVNLDSARDREYNIYTSM